MLGEGTLERMITAEALDGGDIDAFGVRHGYKTGAYRLAVEQNGACAAFAFAAPLFGAGQTAVNAQCIEQARHRRCIDVHVTTVYTETHAAS